MGRWMEIVDQSGNVLIESPPYFLLYTTRNFPKNLRANFPILSRLDIDSDNYMDEKQEVFGDDLLQLEKELSIVRNIINYKHFIEGIDNTKFKAYLLGETDDIDQESRDCLDQMIDQVSEAIDRKLKVVVFL